MSKPRPGRRSPATSRSSKRGPPRPPDAFYLRALAETDPARAIALLDRALDLDPAHGDALASRIRHRIALKSYAAAALDAERLKVARPRSSAGRRMLAQIYLDRLDCPAALAEIEAAIAREPTEAENWWTRGEILLRRHDDPVPILAAYARAVELRPDSALFRVSKGNAHAAQGEHDAALAEYEAALRLDPRSSRRVTGGSTNCARWGAWTRRALWHSISWTIPPRGATRAIGRARSASRCAGWSGSATRPRRARSRTRRSRSIPRASTATWHGRRSAWTWATPTGALADCAAAAQRPVAGIDELVDRLHGLIDQCGRADLALADAERLVAEAPEWPTAWEGSTLVFIALGRADEAIARARRAAELAPHDYSVRNTLAATLGGKYQWEEAAAEQGRALEIYPRAVWARFNRGGFAYRYLGRVEEGLADLDRADTLSPGDEFIGWARSILLAHLGRCEEADAVWRGWQRGGCTALRSSRTGPRSTRSVSGRAAGRSSIWPASWRTAGRRWRGPARHAWEPPNSRSVPRSTATDASPRRTRRCAKGSRASSCVRTRSRTTRTRTRGATCWRWPRRASAGSMTPGRSLRALSNATA